MSEFRKQLELLPRDDLLDLVKNQSSDLWMQVRRIEWVFANKLTHLTWSDGMPITERLVTNEELALLIDEPFSEDVHLTGMGISIEDQRRLHIAKDPVLWAKHFLKVDPRAYQIFMLRHPSPRKVFRAGRRLGKTYTLCVLLMHYSFTHRDGRCIVVAPMKSQVELIFREIIRMAGRSEVVDKTITRRVSSPHHLLEWSTGATIKFFTSGIKAGGKADVVRGQEAHVIVLDELDYMHRNDLESLYAMLQKTSAEQEEKLLIGASTPTGLKGPFYQWCHSPSFKEFWFPSYVNPHFEREMEDEFRLQYTEMAYRHEIEADWGEDTEGVYPRRFVDQAFKFDWRYEAAIKSERSFFVIGVDWDKFGAGTNIVVLEVCDEEYEDPAFRGKIRLAYREEIPKGEYTLTNGIKRIIQLNELFRPRHIYLDRGYGEMQTEELHKYGVDHPESGMRKSVRGVSFSETIAIRDPATKQKVKKELKPFMVDNLRQMLEKGQILFPKSDERYFREHDSIHMQLISYVVARITQTGRQVFEAAGDARDHAHDALILACFAITENYGELMSLRLARSAQAVSNDTFMGMLPLSNDESEREAEIELAVKTWGSLNSAPVSRKRSMTIKMNNRGIGRPIRRKSF